ncbi:MAG: tripartite tricarboxylate transporter substrate binding protein [Pigmentiphaga sp.]|nr:tripartite tricarboxylate transporter substrate binding protein [Pigmentiphaga sp.]
MMKRYFMPSMLADCCDALVRGVRGKTKSLLLATCMASVAQWPAMAVAFPDKPVRLVVGYSPGGAMDTLARRLAESWSVTLGQPVLVDNRPGASGTVAAVSVAKAAPDGHTLLFGENAQLIAPHLQKRMGQPVSVDPFEDFRPVAGAANSVLAVAVSSSFPATDMQGFLDEVRANPGRYFYATSGIGSVHHLGMESIMQAMDLDMIHVPYKGASQILPDLIGGSQIQVGVVSTAAAREFETSGQIRFIGLLAGPRVSSMPELPSFSERMQGYAAAVPRMYILVPKDTSDEAVATLGSTLEAALKDPQLIRAYEQVDSFPGFAPTADLLTQMRRESEAWEGTMANIDLGSR